MGRAGAPVLGVAVTAVRRDAAGPGGFVVEGVLRQSQGGEPFAVDVPVVVQTGKGAQRQVVRIEAAEQAFSFAVADAPLMVHVDPRFDVFRKLDPRETPPSIGQIFGEPSILARHPGVRAGGRAAGVARTLQGLAERQPRDRRQAGHRGG